MMDDRHAQFLVIVADACVGAALGQLTIEIETIHGARITGIPAPDTGALAFGEDDIAESTIRIGGAEVRLGDVAACRLAAAPVSARPQPCIAGG